MSHSEEHAHPGPKTYIKIAVILTAITAVEVLVFYVDSLKSYLVPILAVLSAIKFYLVAAYYMHLKFDSKIFTRLLVGGIVLAFGIMLWLLALYTFAHPIGA